MHDHAFRVYTHSRTIQELSGGVRVCSGLRVRCCSCGVVEMFVGGAWVPMQEDVKAKESPCPTSS
jgi:hypothetical protein